MKQKILTFMVCLLAGITAIHAQTESESSIVSFFKSEEGWKIVNSTAISGNKVVYTFKDGSELSTDVTHGQQAELPVYNAIYCVPGTLGTPLLAEYSQSGQLILMGTANQNDIYKPEKLDDSKKNSITSVDISHLDISTVTSLAYFLEYFSALKRVDFCGGKIHSNVTNLSQMLNGCSELEEVDFSGCDFSGVKNISNLLANCPNLKTIKAINCNEMTISLLREIMNTNGYQNVRIITSDQQEAGSTETTEQD
ncbi:hypothetical protein CIK99_03345 [Prevotella sp. P5-92]|uniref:hypothetical protein n=1 Tax=Prevotella sp. P5-92 TaxID=2024222 RepID=UPI000B96FD52|nr:hypothetical protein [Prevotella sp. P5-92]OYP58684.1 hypothetical protein CIK99_03345 [Prevotella sp. P5-92]